MKNIAVVIGASSSIATSLIARLRLDNSVDQIVSISRTASRGSSANLELEKHFISDYTESSIAEICAQLHAAEGVISKVIICNGILHNEDIYPEKRMEEISANALHEVMHVNAIIPMLWLAKLGPLLKSQQTCRIALLSARVGSISDNRSGGWYAYRASKAALNMLIRTAAIELGRRAPNATIISFHPGTTDTALSKPFQRSVPSSRLFTPDFVADRLLKLMSSLEPDCEARFYDWNGALVEW